MARPAVTQLTGFAKDNAPQALALFADGQVMLGHRAPASAAWAWESINTPVPNDSIPSHLVYSPSPLVLTKLKVLTPVIPTITLGAIVTYSVSPALPAGMALNADTGAITGTPTDITAVDTYTITATNTYGSTHVDLDITVNDEAPSGLRYNTRSLVCTKNSAITNMDPAVSGGTVVSYSVSPSLPTGLSLNTSTGRISGTPTGLHTTSDFVITATNTGGTSRYTLAITTRDVAPSALTYAHNPAVYTKDTPITTNSPSNSGGDVVSYSVSPALPTGLTLNTSTGVISGTPTVAAAGADYVVTATNTGGHTTATVHLTVSAS